MAGSELVNILDYSFSLTTTIERVPHLMHDARTKTIINVKPVELPKTNDKDLIIDVSAGI